MKIIRLFVLALCLFAQNLYGYDDLNKIKMELDDKDWKVRQSAVDKLNDVRNKEHINLLMKVASNRAEYWPVKIKAIQILGKSQDPEALDVLLAIFNDPFNNWECPSIKSYAAYALGNFKRNEKVLNSLINSIDDQEVLTREAIIRALGEIADPRAIPHVLNALKDNSIAIRISAIETLEKIGDISIIPFMENFIEQENDSVIKERALIALENIRNNHK